VYVAGGFSGAGRFGTTTLSSVGNADVFVAKLVDVGTSSSFGWVQQAGGGAVDYASALSVVGANIYAGGRFFSTVATFGNTTLTNASASGTTSDAFVSKLTDAGSSSTFAWTQRAGGPASDAATALAVSGSSVYAAGIFAGASAGFGSTTLPNTSSTTTDVFIARLADAGSSGGFVWAQAAGGSRDDYASALALRGTTVYVAGYVVPTATFGPFSIATPTNGVELGFLATLTDAVGLPTHPTAAPSAFACYPNPARATVRLLVPDVAGSPLAVAPATLIFCDALGRAVRTQPVTLPAGGGPAEVSLAGLQPGFYQVRLLAGARQHRATLAVE
jgi:hypothetical protein